MADETNPINEMFAVDDEAARAAPQPEAEINATPPEDKKPQERDESGKFKGEDKKLDEAKKPDEKKPEVKAEEKPADTVPLAKFLRVQAELKEQLGKGELTIGEMRKELDELKAKLPKPEAPPDPDFVENPKGYVDAKLNGVLEKIAAANKTAEESGKKAEATATQAAEQVQVQAFMADLQSEEATFMQTAPDYYDALTHLRNIRTAQLKEFNPDITPEQISMTIRREEIGMAVQLKRAGRNATQVAYNIAKLHGYVPKAAAHTPSPSPSPTAALPDVPNKRLPPEQTLGSGSAPADPDVYQPGETDPFDTAMQSLFGKRKAS
jgi:hypothetical protein